MKPSNRFLAALAAAAALAALALVFPHRGNAFANTPVVVENTSSAPAIVSNISDPGREAYQSTVNMTGLCTGASCSFLYTAIPTGHRVVIQHIAGVLDITGSATTHVNIFGSSSLSGVVTTYTAFFAPYNSPVSAFDQPVQFYVDAGQTPEVQVTLSNGTFITGTSTQRITLTGYSLDCTAAPCSAIAH